ncbi:dihydrodipicolinate synthase family protein [Tuberibacillus sp. Marseille-P3662]|uniref:dihydrodipicolinate synthase family protein n=1 Tax=Tuberibacillus sp. Marseille-P3662 TaxID=1965358 RepID=UPI000A1CCEC3|nr:dihydrodipicolinate synthase family protein [Tuberibacillus sp. Marseille-P3662]
MVQKNGFQGVMPPISTVFDEDGHFDTHGMGRLIDTLTSTDIQGLLVLGSGGEFSQMSFEQRKEVAEFSVSYVNDRVPVLIGTGATSTREAILLSQHAQEIGAAGVVVVNPYYWHLSKKNLFDHYTEISRSIDIPILLYNFPDLTGQDLSPDLVLELVEENSNIVGIKETVDGVGHIREMILKVKKRYPDFRVLAGLDDHLLNTLQLGGDGGIPGSANFAPELTVGIYQAYQEKNFKIAEAFQRRLAILPLMYQLDSPLISAIKEAIHLRGLNISTQVLAPAKKLDKENKDRLKEILKSASLL